MRRSGLRLNPDSNRARKIAAPQHLATPATRRGIFDCRTAITTDQSRLPVPISLAADNNAAYILKFLAALFSDNNLFLNY
jgi:hypothetical protein